MALRNLLDGTEAIMGCRENQLQVAVIGLGYVGLPLAIEFGKKRSVTGFDLNKKRIDDLRLGVDHTLEVDADEFRASELLVFSNDIRELAHCNVYIVCVPTPVDEHKQPDLTSLLGATQLVGGVLKKGDIVIYESTVYPGATEEECVPVLESVSSLKFNEDFYVGYSPERINPGDKEHRISNVLKVTSGSTVDAAEIIDKLYQEIIVAGTYKAESIRVAEAAKVIENTQRDLNIALINELAIIFNKMGIDTSSVLDAAATKWNFLPFKPGLVGGHCIGVDPYYLTYKSQALGYRPEIILAGRRLNDNMGAYIASQLIKAMLGKGINTVGVKILIMGLTFKENCPDIRNSKVFDVIRELRQYSCSIDIFDPWVDKIECQREYGVTPIDAPKINEYDAILIAVGHNIFKDMGAIVIKNYAKPKNILYDIKSILDKRLVDITL